MSAPLLKVPLLLGNAVCMYYGMKPPRPPPPPKELRNFDRPDFLSATARLQFLGAAVLRGTLSGLAAAEAVFILAQRFPSPVSDAVLPLLAPVAAPSAIRLSITPVFLAGSTLAIAGGLLRLWCHRTLGKYFTWQVSVQDDHKLITTGPYSFVRHPSYFGALMMLVGKTLSLLGPGSYPAESGIMGTWWGKGVVGGMLGYWAWVVLALLRRASKEDDVLSRRFGEQWRVWSRKTKYRAIPFIY
ncbi:ICMT-domain-containing protein [Trametes maxima]|nr:ICMT-domain-containing protein [Trametes maxima]